MTGSKPPSKRGGIPCPVCGTTTYSAAGMHPQCAAVQSDLKIKKELQQKKKDEESEAKNASKKNSRWQKRCSGCGVDVHVRLKKCDCGYEF